MKAFISYSHADDTYLALFQKHLAQLRREGSISDWTDNAISAGGSLDSEISKVLDEAEIFIALVSPDYLSSNYCYEKEFAEAQRRHKEGSLKIVPVILEPCDWQNTPFGSIKALPKDGKAVALWNNQNTAMMDVTAHLRNISNIHDTNTSTVSKVGSIATKKYKIKKDFDSIEKMEFVDKAFNDVTKKIQDNLAEILSIDNIKARIIENNDNEMSCLLVNRNKISENEAALKISKSGTKQSQSQTVRFFQNSEYWIKFEIGQSSHSRSEYIFNLSFDEFHLFWVQNNNYNRQVEVTSDTTDMVNQVWQAWLESVGIV
tara:strand:+ start:1829 stop:2779 length:951 start_codon:yes stop_codon:yes gene_type:complete